MKTLMLFGLSILVSGCATTASNAYRSMTSGQIGCPEDAIQMSNLDQGYVTTTWEATCKGKKFFCTNSRGSGWSMSTQTTCKEAM